MSKRIAVFPEPGAIGPIMNLVGIAQGLQARGHEVIFILEPGMRGAVEKYGFAERYISCMPPMTEAQAAAYWDDFMARFLPSFRTSPYDQVGTYVKGCWEAIIDTVKWSVTNGLDSLLADIRPDLIINDNVAVYPATQQAGCPWVRMISCAETEISDPDIPPQFSGCAENDTAGFARYRKQFEREIKPLHDDFMDFLADQGCNRLDFPEFLAPSPYLNLLLYPEPLRYTRKAPLDPEIFVYLDGCVRQEDTTYEVPAFKKNNDCPLIYLSYGSLGGSDVDLIKRVIGVLGNGPFRVLANVGDNLDQYDAVPDNVIVDSWYPQIGLLPHVDVFIQHGGNNSFNESLFFGIAPLVMPFVWDAHDNAQRVNDTRHGIGMHRYDWTDKELLANINTLLTDDEIKANVQATSAGMQARDGRNRAAETIDDFLRKLPN